VLAAEVVEGGTWRVAATFREALADPRRMRLVLVPKLPAPAIAVRLRVEGFGPPAGDQPSLLAEPAAMHTEAHHQRPPPGERAWLIGRVRHHPFSYTVSVRDRATPRHSVRTGL
jgi:hypothetical protein